LTPPYVLWQINIENWKGNKMTIKSTHSPAEKSLQFIQNILDDLQIAEIVPDSKKPDVFRVTLNKTYKAPDSSFVDMIDNFPDIFEKLMRDAGFTRSGMGEEPKENSFGIGMGIYMDANAEISMDGLSISFKSPVEKFLAAISPTEERLEKALFAGTIAGTQEREVAAKRRNLSEQQRLSSNAYSTALTISLMPS
jgi:hypothetical protein